MAKNLKNGMEAKFKFIETDKKYIMTTALDPRFKTSFFRFNETTSIIKNAMIEELSEKFMDDDFISIAGSSQYFPKSPDLDTPRSKSNSLSFAE